MNDNMKESFAPTSKDGLHDKLQLLRAPFPPEKISRKPKGGTMLDYVGHADITERLLDIDPEWNWQPCRWHDGVPEFERDKTGKPIGLWIRLTVCGVTRYGYGSVEPNVFDAEKQLIGDALRNAAMRFGVALELWSKTERASASAPPPVRAQRVEREITPPARTQPAAAPQVEAQPEPQSDEDAFMDRLVNQFGGEEVAESAGPAVIKGVPVSPSLTVQWAYAQVLPFGKFKNQQLSSIVAQNDGFGYLKWLADKISEQYLQGKAPKQVEEAVLLVYKNEMEKGE